MQMPRLASHQAPPPFNITVKRRSEGGQDDEDNDNREGVERASLEAEGPAASGGGAALPRDPGDGTRGKGKARRLRSKRRKGPWEWLKRHVEFVGPGVVASVAYIDPGNWATATSAGSQFGYSHLFVILLSGCMALLIQVLATRLGCVSGSDLAETCRQTWHDRPKHKRLFRWGLLYPLYAIAEIGIIFTDLAELLGSAIAINLLIPRIPLYGAVLITSVDVFLILILFSEYPAKFVTRSMRFFEMFIGFLVVVVLGSFVALLVKVSPVWKDVFHGYVPGPGIVQKGGLYVAVGIFGATIMPHAVFIGSKMATMRRLMPEDYEETYPSDEETGEGAFTEDDDEDRQQQPKPPTSRATRSSLGAIFSNLPAPRPRARSSSSGMIRPHLHLPQPVPLGMFNLNAPRPSPEERRAAVAAAAGVSEEGKESEKAELVRERPTLACVVAHLNHSIVDIAGSLLGFAIMINSAILIVAAAVFYYGEGRSSSGTGVSDLFDAYELVKVYVGQSFAYLFAIGLLASGQSASLTVTLSGQIISEGFIRWRTKPWKRRLITRLIGMIPSLAVAIAIGRDGIDNLLVFSQVALSIVLPFVITPLIIFTSSHAFMSIPVSPSTTTTLAPSPPPPQSLKSRLLTLPPNPFKKRKSPEGHVSFANATWVIYLACAIWTVICMANVVALVELGQGES
ncbi:Nramp-domain-containing protein [Meredithblackwellia eburnea MCA 4105]